MARSARMFLCARCRQQVLLCSHCDHGQRYCSRACSSASRRGQRRQSSQDYQRSARGRLKHAARTALWRRRCRARHPSGALGAANKVTHQGCLDGPAQAPLLVCDTPSAYVPIVPIQAIQDTASAVSSSALSVLSSAAIVSVFVCRRCAAPLLPHVRQRFMRPSSERLRHAYDHLS
jgi:hypothetical protein